jgi:hypothetical protein
MRKEGLSFPDAKRICMAYVGLSNGNAAPQPRQIVRRFRWLDANGREAWHLRWEPGKPKFTWAQDKDGRYPGLGMCAPTLYDLPRVRTVTTVIVVEGERDADRLNAWLTELGRADIWATTPAYGGSDVKDEYLKPLHGKTRIYLSGDADEVGKKFIEQCGSRLSRHVKELRILMVPRGSKDWAAWAEVEGTAQAFGALLQVAQVYRELSPGMVLTKLGDLLAEPEEKTAWVVENRLPVGGLSLLCGKPKAGKSTLARVLALAVARGAAWLSCPTTQGTVFYLALEEKRAEVKKHFLAMGASSADPISVFIAPSPSDGLQQLRLATEREQPAFIVIDPLLRFVRVKDANDYAAMTGALEPLLTLARETRAHVLAVHHMGKGKRDGGDAILGSTAIFAAVDTALLLKRSEKYRTLSTLQRYGEDLEEITLTLDSETRMITAGPSRKEADEEATAILILDFLRPQSEPLEESAIQDAVEGRKAVKVRALRRLVEEGKVTRTGDGKRAAPYRYDISGSVVPSICREQENQKPKTAEIQHQDCTNTGSRYSYYIGSPPESWEPEMEVINLVD